MLNALQTKKYSKINKYLSKGNMNYDRWPLYLDNTPMYTYIDKIKYFSNLRYYLVTPQNNIIFNFRLLNYFYFFSSVKFIGLFIFQI